MALTHHRAALAAAVLCLVAPQNRASRLDLSDEAVEALPFYAKRRKHAHEQWLDDLPWFVKGWDSAADKYHDREKKIGFLNSPENTFRMGEAPWFPATVSNPDDDTHFEKFKMDIDDGLEVKVFQVAEGIKIQHEASFWYNKLLPGTIPLYAHAIPCAGIVQDVKNGGTMKFEYSDGEMKWPNTNFPDNAPWRYTNEVDWTMSYEADTLFAPFANANSHHVIQIRQTEKDEAGKRRSSLSYFALACRTAYRPTNTYVGRRAEAKLNFQLLKVGDMPEDKKLLSDWHPSLAISSDKELNITTVTIKRAI